MGAEDRGAGRWWMGILFSFFLIPKVKIGKWGPWQGADPIRRRGSLQGGRHPIRSPGSCGQYQQSVDPQSPRLGFLSGHRCTYLESAYHSDTLKSVAFQCKPTRMGKGAAVEGEVALPPLSLRLKRPGLTSRSPRPTVCPWGKPHLPWYGLFLWRHRG